MKPGSRSERSEGLGRRRRGGGGEGRPGEDEERSGSAEAWRAGRLKVEKKNLGYA
jgi:ferric-dicitrate binding protein FerR (iron transport regulator)